jgi:adenylate cyclase
MEVAMHHNSHPASAGTLGRRAWIATGGATDARNTSPPTLRDPTAQVSTFLFADISGYSLLAELEGDEAAADVALGLVATASSLAPDHRAEVVKCIGDGVMVHGYDAAECLGLGLELLAAWAKGLLSPPIHLGIHSGPAIERAHDWWGATVNVAARVAAAAGPGQLLVTDAAKLAAGALPETRLRWLGWLRAKNITSPISVYSASRVTATVGAGRERTWAPLGARDGGTGMTPRWPTDASGRPGGTGLRR